jgi:hypothetical protein
MSEVSRAFVTVRIARIAAVPAHLLQIAAACESSDSHSRPPELGHELCQTTACPGSSALLRDLKEVEQQLRGNALDAIVADFTAYPFQPQPPGIGTTCSQFGLRLMELVYQRHDGLRLLPLAYSEN